MHLPSDKSESTGFTLLELLVITTLILMAALVGYPAFNNFIDKARITAVTRSVATNLQVARQEAIKAKAPVVAQPDFDNDEIVFFVNVDGDANYQFNPDPAAVHRTADYELARVHLQADYNISFWSAQDQQPEGRRAIEGLTATSAPLNAAVFQPNGAIVDTGAIHIADGRSNFFQIQLAFASTGKVRILKYNPEPSWGGAAGFYPRGRHPDSDDPMWVWF